MALFPLLGYPIIHAKIDKLYYKAKMLSRCVFDLEPQ